MKVQKLALYNIEWQTLRVNLTFNTFNGIQASCDILEDYYSAPLEGYDTEDNKLWRIINLLNAVCMGLSGQVKVARDDQRVTEVTTWIEYVQERRKMYQDRYHAGQKVFKWGEELERGSISVTDTSNLLAVYKSLTKRKHFAKETKGMPVDKTRPELLRYINMISDELTKRI